MPRQEIRSKLNALPQDLFFLNGTVRKNMDPYETSTDELITRVLKNVELWPALDEATSSVDRKTDQVMQRVIREAFRDKTIFVIVTAHRLETIMDFDCLAVFDNGSLPRIF